MTYVSWAVFHEGYTDGLYFEVLLPRLMEHIVLSDGIRHSEVPLLPAISLGNEGRALTDVAKEICRAKDAFKVVFVHADRGGRALERGLTARSVSYCQRAFELCGWPAEHCITINPRHETEAWILADPMAVLGALGYHGDPAKIGLPFDARGAEGLTDPKATLEAAMRKVTGKRRRGVRVEQLFPAIAQRQSISALRGSSSFRDFEHSLRRCLADLRCIAGK